MAAEEAHAALRAQQRLRLEVREHGRGSLLCGSLLRRRPRRRRKLRFKRRRRVGNCSGAGAETATDTGAGSFRSSSVGENAARTAVAISSACDSRPRSLVASHTKCRFDPFEARAVPVMQRTIADQIDQTRRAATRLVYGIEGLTRELDLALAFTGDAEPDVT